MSRKVLKDTGGFFRPGTLALLAPLVLILIAASAPNAPPPLWWTTHALVKVRPGDAAPAVTRNAAEISAARNEFEPFQIVIRPSGADVEGADVEAADLLGPGGAVISREHVRIYLQPFIRLRQSSSPARGSGEWPDPLIPRTDLYAGERRSGFPFRARGGRNQPIWVEVYVPPDAPPGDYSGQIRIIAGEIAPFSVPIRLRVWNFSLPSTATLKTSYGLSGVNVLKQHRGSYTRDEELRSITRLYAKAALWHRVSVHGGTFLPPPFARGEIDWSNYDREVGPFLDGTVFTKRDPLYGARANSIDLRTGSDADTAEKKAEYWRAWVLHFEERGWLDRLFYYVWDEPEPDDLMSVAERARIARRADPRLRVLVTTSYHELLDDLIDIWSPLINCVVAKPGFPEYCERAAPRETYDAVVQAGGGLWWYQSCASHGCKGPGGEYFKGWPSYLIDDSAVANRIMPWLSWKYRMEGELYYNMTEAPDPWNDIHLFGGNGDGTLFYPGRPDRIGGRTDVPIESIRLKLIREGLEDYEYFALLARIAGRERVDELVSEVVRTAYDFDLEAERLYAVRRRLGDAIERAAAASAAPPPRSQ
jgi:hypothetical protein